MLQTVNSMMDQLRTAQTSGVLTQAQVAGAGGFEAQQLLPYAKQSPAALAQLGIISQEMGGPAYQATRSQAQNFAALSGFIDKTADSAKQYTATQDTMAVGMSHISSQAASFSSVMSTDLTNSMAAGVVGLEGGNKAMTAFASSISGKNIDTSALATVVSTLKNAGESAQSIGLMTTDAAQARGATASQVAQITSAVSQDLGLVSPAQMARNALAAGSAFGQKYAPTARQIAQQSLSVAVPAPGQAAHAAAVAAPQIPHVGDQLFHYKGVVDPPPVIKPPSGGVIQYQARTATPHPQPPPPGGTVNYPSKVQAPVAPPAPAGGTVVYHSIVIGPGGGGGTASVSGGAGNVSFHGQSGFRVPGSGSGDIVPAMLEPGEAVVPKHLVPSLAPFLGAHKVPGFASGGVAGDMLGATLTRATGLINNYGNSGGNWGSQQWGQMSSTFMQAAQLAHVMGSASGFASGGIVPASTLSGIKSQINTEWQTLDALYAKENAATGNALAALKNQVSSFWGNIMDPLYAAENRLTGKASGGPAGSATAAAAAKPVTGSGPIPDAAAQKVFDSFEKTFSSMGNPWGQLASQILNGMLDGIKKAPQTAQAAQALVSKVTSEINYGKGVASAAVSGLGLGSMANLPTPTMTAQGQPYQMYTDQASLASGAISSVSVQQQMGDYLQAMQSFQGDMHTLAKGGLSKALQKQLYSAGPVQGDELAQSILGGQGGIGGANKLWSQINAQANKLGVSAIGNIYGQPPAAAHPALTGKAVKVGVTADTGAAQAAINAIHGKSVSVSINISMSTSGGGGGGGGGGLNLSAAQIKSISGQVQSKLLAQAKNNRRTGVQLPGYGS
jgi:hypothetical protein